MLGKAREGSRSSGRLGRAWDGSGGMKNNQNAELYANNYEKLQKCGTVCKEGGVDLQHPPTFAHSSTLVALFIIWQITKEGKSVELYAKVGGVCQQPPCKSGKSVKHSSKMQLFIIWQIMKSGKSVGLYAKVGGGSVNNPPAKV